MSITSRQNNLILAEDWTRIYQTFKNADFKSYDFENLRRVMIDYLRENYREDFNDYIESSEYLALIDLIAFLGQSLSFRIDLASRENFIELAERKESVLRLARMLSYNASRNIPGSGLLKFDTISTTESLIDANGRNLARQSIVWNDPTNPSWYEQFIKVINSAMISNIEFGKSQSEKIIDGIRTNQYRFNSSNTSVPIYTFSKLVANRNMVFEIVSSAIKDIDDIYEEAPLPANQFSFIHRDDKRGNGSDGTGFFVLFKQGSLELVDFTITQPTPNEKVNIESDNINNTDVWLYSLNSLSKENELWTQVSSLVGNNIIYNSINKNIKNIYSVITKDGDRAELAFSDGVYGTLPSGPFRLYYRVSNGLRYYVSPREMRGISITIPYTNSSGASHQLTVTMSLKNAVNNSSPSEDINSIRDRAPANYYVQNRMVTGEDYNLAPLTNSQEILKVKSVNRTSSGISRNYDIIDASGKYSAVNVFGDDGILTRNEIETTLSFTVSSRNQVINYIRNTIVPELRKRTLYDFYLNKFIKIYPTDVNSNWTQVTTQNGTSTGYFSNDLDERPYQVGVYTTSNLKFVETGAMVKFVPPGNKAFKNGKLVDFDINDPGQTDRMWVKVVQVIGDGSNGGKGKLANGLGPVTLNDEVPTYAIPAQIMPKFVNIIPSSIEEEIVNLIVAGKSFGLRYDIYERAWKIIFESNLNVIQRYDSGIVGDTTNQSLDTSWLFAFIYNGAQYSVRIRGLEYSFESVNQSRFYFDSSEKIYDSKTGKVIKDQIKVLGINPQPNLISPLIADFPFEVINSVRYDDGYQNHSAVRVSFIDSDDDGVIDNPDTFDQIVRTNDSIATITKVMRSANVAKITTAAPHLLTLGTIIEIICSENTFSGVYQVLNVTSTTFTYTNTGVDLSTIPATGDILSLDSSRSNNYLFFELTTTSAGDKIYNYVPNTDGKFIIEDTEKSVNVNDYSEGQLVYFSNPSEDAIKKVIKVSNGYVFQLAEQYHAREGRSNLKFQYIHNSSSNRRVDPSSSNIMDIYLLTKTYDEEYRTWLRSGIGNNPVPLTSEAMRVQFGSALNQIKSISDEVIYHPAEYKLIFGSLAETKFQAKFKVVKNSEKYVNDNELKVAIIQTVNEFFNITNWDFGDRFFFSELSTYVVEQNSPNISNFVLVPTQTDQSFGSLFEIQARPDEIFVSGATVDDVEIVDSLNAAQLRASGLIITSTS